MRSLTHELTRVSIERMTSEQITSAIVDAGYAGSIAGKRLRKTELVDLALVIVKKMLDKKTENDRVAKILRDARLAADVVDPRFISVKNNMAVALAKLSDDHSSKVEEFALDISKAATVLWKMESVIEWNTEDAMLCVKIAKKIERLLKIVEKEVNDPGMTIEEFTNVFSELRMEFMNELVRGSGFDPSSTSPMQNLGGVVETKAIQYAYKLTDYICRKLPKALQEDPSELGCIHVY